MTTTATKKKVAMTSEKHEAVHVIVYGDTQAKKTTFAATFPKSSKRPMWVALFDPPDKAAPYYRKGTVGPIEKGEFGPFRSVMNKDGNEIIRVNFFHDLRLLKKKPKVTAYSNFLMAMDRMYDEIDQWSTIVIDSVTYLDLCARNYEQYVVNPGAKEPRQWRAGAADAIERVIMCGLAYISECNVIVIAHTGNKEVTMHMDKVHSLAAPGRLQKNMPTGYGELYHAVVVKDEDDEDQSIWQLQTRPTEEFFAGSLIGAPNLCPPDYKALWLNES